MTADPVARDGSGLDAAATPADRTAGVEGYVLVDQVGFLLRRAHQRSSAIFQNHISALTPTQWAAMVKLREMGVLSQNLLGRLTAMDAATMQSVIRRLAERGLVERCADPVDRRRLVLELTEEGRRLVEDCLDGARAVSRETLAPLTARERQTFLRLLRRLG